MTGEKLRGVFERRGFTEVASVLASGNILPTRAEEVPLNPHTMDTLDSSAWVELGNEVRADGP